MTSSLTLFHDFIITAYRYNTAIPSRAPCPFFVDSQVMTPLVTHVPVPPATVPSATINSPCVQHRLACFQSEHCRDPQPRRPARRSKHKHAPRCCVAVLTVAAVEAVQGVMNQCACSRFRRERRYFLELPCPRESRARPGQQRAVNVCVSWRSERVALAGCGSYRGIIRGTALPQQLQLRLSVLEMWLL